MFYYRVTDVIRNVLVERSLSKNTSKTRITALTNFIKVKKKLYLPI